MGKFLLSKRKWWRNVKWDWIEENNSFVSFITTPNNKRKRVRNLRREQSDPCQLRSQVHISFAPQVPCPEHALGHSAETKANPVEAAMSEVIALVNFIVPSFLFRLIG